MAIIDLHDYNREVSADSVEPPNETPVARSDRVARSHSRSQCREARRAWLCRQQPVSDDEAPKPDETEQEKNDRLARNHEREKRRRAQSMALHEPNSGRNLEADFEAEANLENTAQILAAINRVAVTLPVTPEVRRIQKLAADGLKKELHRPPTPTSSRSARTRTARTASYDARSHLDNIRCGREEA